MMLGILAKAGMADGMHASLHVLVHVTLLEKYHQTPLGRPVHTLDQGAKRTEAIQMHMLFRMHVVSRVVKVKGYAMLL